MHKFLLKTAIVLGGIFCLGVFPHGTFAAEKTEKPLEAGGALSGIRLTGGVFVSDLRNAHYVASAEKKITPGAQDRYTLSIGGLAHVPIPPRVPFIGLEGALALSGGIAGDFSTPNGQLAVKGQVALGLSLLFDSGEHLFALTAGYIVKPVARLSGYKVGDPFPAAGASPTKSVYRHGLFLGVTSNFKFPNWFSPKQEKVVQDDTGTGSEGPSEQDDSKQGDKSQEKVGARD